MVETIAVGIPESIPSVFVIATSAPPAEPLALAARHLHPCLSRAVMSAARELVAGPLLEAAVHPVDVSAWPGALLAAARTPALRDRLRGVTHHVILTAPSPPAAQPVHAQATRAIARSLAFATDGVVYDAHTATVIGPAARGDIEPPEFRLSDDWLSTAIAPEHPPHGHAPPPSPHASSARPRPAASSHPPMPDSGPPSRRDPAEPLDPQVPVPRAAGVDLGLDPSPGFGRVTGSAPPADPGEGPGAAPGASPGNAPGEPRHGTPGPGGEPGRRDGVVVRSGPPDRPGGVIGERLMEVTTRGLARFGLPELVVGGVRADHLLIAVSLLRGVAVHLLAGHWAWLASGGGRSRRAEARPRIGPAEMYQYWGRAGLDLWRGARPCDPASEEAVEVRLEPGSPACGPAGARGAAEKVPRLRVGPPGAGGATAMAAWLCGRVDAIRPRMDPSHAPAHRSPQPENPGPE